MMAAYDIDTAAEVLERIAIMRGLIRDQALRQVVAWANACARNFQPNPAQGMDAEGVEEVDSILLQQQEALLHKLRQGQSELESLSGEISSQRAAKQRELEDARRAVRQAEGGEA